MSFVACEKENNNGSTAQPQAENVEASILLFYEVDGVASTQTLYSQDELASWVSVLSELTAQGHEVNIQIVNQSASTLSKEIIKFSTTNKEEYDAWVLEMLRQGYAVGQGYDEETGEYRGYAIKK